MWKDAAVIGVFLFVPSLLAGATLRVPADHPTIQEAIDRASDGDTVLVSAGVYEVTRPVVFRSKAISVQSVDGAAATTVRMTEPEDPGRASVFAFDGSESSGARLEGFTITGGRGTKVTIPALPGGQMILVTTGGGIFCGAHAAPQIVRNVLRANEAEYGAAVGCSVEAQPRLVENEITDNTAVRIVGDRSRGGGLACFSDSLVEVEGGLFARNHAGDGGAIYLGDASLITITGVRFEENNSKDDGGAILCRGDRLIVNNSSFVRNQSQDEAGAIGVRNSSNTIRVSVSDCRFEENRADMGGALYLDVPHVEPGEGPVVSSCRFLANRADTFGGAATVYYETDWVVFQDSTFEKNRASVGGALFIDYEASAHVIGSFLRQNTAIFGGAIYVDEAGAQLENCVLNANVARRGGAVASDSGLAMLNCTVAGNVAQLGGGIYTFFRFQIASSILWDNAGGSLVAEVLTPPILGVQEVDFSCVEGEDVLPGVGNINVDPRFGAWGSRAVVHVDAASPGPGDGSLADPYSDLEPALATYDFSLAADSPCLGTGPDGTNRGARTGVVDSAGSPARAVRLAAGTYRLAGLVLAHRASIEGAGAEVSVLEGSVLGLRSGAKLSRVSVSRGTLGGIVVSAEESPTVEDVVVRGNWGDLGGGVSCWHGARPVFRHVTISGNAALEGGALFSLEAAPTFSSCILAENAGGSILATRSPDLEVTFSCVEGDPLWPGEGNIRSAPRFGGWPSQTVHVDAASSGPGDGMPATPFAKLESAFAGYRLALAGDSPCRGRGEGGSDMGADVGTVANSGSEQRTIRLAAGTYPIKGLNLAHGVSLEGAGAEETILEGTVVGLRTARRLESLTVTLGDRSGVVVSPGESPTVEDCALTDNTVLEYRNTSVPSLECGLPALGLVCGSSRGGGGAYCARESAPEFVSCRLEGNRADLGGGVFLWLESAARFDRCTFVGNWALHGAAADFHDARPSFENCLFQGNKSPAFGGGVLYGHRVSVKPEPLVLNCTVADNLVGGGPAVICDLGSGPQVINSIFYNNSQFDDGALCGDLVHSLTDQDPRFVRRGTYDDSRIAFSTVEGRVRWLPDVVVEEGDYRLRPDSPAIDAGTAQPAPNTDIEGTARSCGQGVDMGAYEYCGDPIQFRRGDPNADGNANLADAVFVLSFQFLGGPEPDCLDAADINDTGDLDLTDAVFLLSHLFLGGPAPPPPFPLCDIDSTPSELTCLAYSLCP